MKKKPAKPTRRAVKPGPARCGRPEGGEEPRPPSVLPLAARIGAGPRIVGAGGARGDARRPSSAGARGPQPRQQRLLHHPERGAAPLRAVGLGSEPTEVHSVSFRRLPPSSRGTLEEVPDADARERPRPRAGQRNGDEELP